MTVRLDLADAPIGVRELVARVQDGSEVEVWDGEKVVATLLPPKSEHPMRESRQSLRGLYRGQIEMADDFAASLTDDELKELGL